MRSIILACALLAALSAAARAEEDEAARAARWRDLQHAVFGDRPVRDAGALVAIDAPARALDAALVPIGVTLAPEMAAKSLYLLVDANPSPLAATVHFGPGADPHQLKTRVRVDAYTLVHAVAEAADGQLYMTAAYVKAAGGCSAPAAGDATAALARIGQMRLKAAGAAGPAATPLQLLISHPNYNGMQMDQVSRNFTPARYVQDVRVTQGGTLVMDIEADISLSEDPAITFGLRPQGAQPLAVEVVDSTRATFRQQLPLPAGGS